VPDILSIPLVRHHTMKLHTHKVLSTINFSTEWLSAVFVTFWLSLASGRDLVSHR